MTNGNDLIHSTDTRFVEVDKDGLPIYAIVKEGLTKREYFAAMAMQGILCQLRADIVTAKMQAEYYAKEYPNKTMFEAVALESAYQADALIKALNETENK